MNAARHQEKAGEELAKLKQELQAVLAACYAKAGAATAVTRADASRFEELRAGFAKLREGVFGEAEHLANEFFRERFLSAKDYYTHLAIPKDTIFPLAPLILLDEKFQDILKGPCPFDKDRKLHESHLLLTPPPEKFTLNALSAAVGGKAGQVLYSDWFLTDPIGEKLCGKKSFALIPATGEFAPKTKRLGHAASKDALLEHYPDYVEADALRLSTALILHERKNRIRLHQNDWGWCEDLHGAGSASALNVGLFDALGLKVDDYSLDFTLEWLGCAALRNIGTR